eukprot:8654907-Ditylum_brightwellii.AAC.1
MDGPESQWETGEAAVGTTNVRFVIPGCGRTNGAGARKECTINEDGWKIASDDAITTKDGGIFRM